MRLDYSRLYMYGGPKQVKLSVADAEVALEELLQDNMCQRSGPSRSPEFRFKGL